MVKNQKTLSSYLLGYALSLILTCFAFSIVFFKLMPESLVLVSLFTLAILQLMTQTLCFLRLNTSSEGRWNLLPFLFTLFIISILAGGSLWIMYHLNLNMH